MTGSIQNPQVLKLLRLAQADEMTLQFALPDSIFGFHGQQSCEKLLKAFITGLGAKYSFTHDLRELAKTIEGMGEHLPPLPFHLRRLQEYAVEFRYDDGPPLAEPEREQIRASVVTLREHVITRVLALQTAGGSTP